MIGPYLLPDTWVIAQCWLLLPLQVQISTLAPSLVLPPATSRHIPFP